MTDVADVYADFAALAASPAGMTLTLLRSVPLVPQPGAAPSTEGEPPPMEVVARVRFGPAFALALRDLLDRTIDKTIEIVPADATDPPHSIVSSATSAPATPG